MRRWSNDQRHELIMKIIAQLYYREDIVSAQSAKKVVVVFSFSMDVAEFQIKKHSALVFLPK